MSLYGLGPFDITPGRACDHCDAVETRRAIGPGEWAVSVEHEEGCPVLHPEKWPKPPVRGMYD